ncbi:MAG: hypothetical protein R3A79_31665, partial [Nannocystaceae bacterium]
MPSIPGGLTWDPQDRLQKTDHQGGGITYYVYDSSGIRARKVHVNQAGTMSKERLYLGPWETYRETTDLLGTPTLDLERETLHVQTEAGDACLLETKTVENAATYSRAPGRSSTETVASCGVRRHAVRSITSRAEGFSASSSTASSRDGSELSALPSSPG